ncbi:MAG: RDD family protein [Planctomycetota bacterium]|nr:RDD family protein [Planctomycetota bacterium]
MAAFFLCLSGCDPTAPRYGAVFPLKRGDSCVLVLQTAGILDQGPRFRIYRSANNGLTQWVPVGPERSGVACGATVSDDELLVFHENSVSVIGLTGDPPSWRSLAYPIEGLLECGEVLDGACWTFGKDVKKGRLGAARYREGSFPPEVVWGPPIPHESFLLMAFRHGDRIVVAWRGVSKGGKLPDMPVEYCAFDGASFSEIRSAELPGGGFAAMWSEGERIAGVLQGGSGTFWGGDCVTLFRIGPEGLVRHWRIEATAGGAILFRPLYVGHVEIGGSHYVFRSSAQKIEGWKVEGDDLAPLGGIGGIPAYEHESWAWGLLAGFTLSVALVVAWSRARRREKAEVFARILDRAAAYAIDTALMLGIATGVSSLLPGAQRGPAEWMLPAQADLATIWFGTVVAYTTVFEWMVMATPGKLLVGLRVAREDGSPPTLGQVLVRNAIGFFERNPMLAPLCALPVMLLSHKVQRVGDMLARTVVLTSEAAAIAAITGRLPSRDGRNDGRSGSDDGSDRTERDGDG